MPHRSNNHKAKILHPSALSVVVALFLISQFGINFTLLFQPSILGFATDITPGKVIELTNQERLNQGLKPLSLNPVLNQAAQMKAGDMFAFNYWAHTSPSGRDPWAFFKEAGYSYVYAGENLARDFMNSESVVQAWMNSPTHRDNIVNGKYQEIGLAVVDGSLNGVETTLVVQLFGTPTPTPAPVAEAATIPAETIGVSSLPTAAPLFEAEVGDASQAEEPFVLAPVAFAQAKETDSQPLVSPFGITKIAAVLILGIILGVLALDVVLVHRKKIVRLSGRNLAHLIFVAVLLLSVLLTTPGMII